MGYGLFEKVIIVLVNPTHAFYFYNLFVFDVSDLYENTGRMKTISTFDIFSYLERPKNVSIRDEYNFWERNDMCFCVLLL